MWTGIAVGTILSVACAALLILRQYGWSLAEAVAGGLTMTLMLLSLVWRAALVAGRPDAVGPVALGLILLAGVFLILRRHTFCAQIALGLSFGRANRLASAVIPGAMVAMAAISVSGGYCNDALCTRALVGIFSFSIVAAATYALARRYAWPPTAVTVTLITLSQPRLVRVAIANVPEMLSAASCLFCLLALYRTVERPRFADFALLVLGLSFTLCDLPLDRAFALVLTVLGAVVLYRRHGGRLWWAMVRQRPWLSLAVVIGGFAFGGIWHPWLATAAGVTGGNPGYPLNADAIIGATANLLRYLFESLDLGASLEQLGQIVLEIGPAQRIEVLYRFTVHPFFGGQGAAAPFRLVAGSDLDGVWFGLPGLFFVLPAVSYAMVRGPRRLKAVAVALAGYGYLATLIPAWLPGNASLFTRFFACGGFMVAFLLPPWRLTRPGKISLQILCLLLIAVTLLEAAGWAG